MTFFKVPQGNKVGTNDKKSYIIYGNFFSFFKLSNHGNFLKIWFEYKLKLLVFFI